MATELGFPPAAKSTFVAKLPSDAATRSRIKHWKPFKLTICHYQFGLAIPFKSPKATKKKGSNSVKIPP
jgi:hypothetical protein